MSRTRRMSRWLIAVTAIVLAMGLIFWVKKVNRGPQTAVAAPATRPAGAMEVAAPAATQPALGTSVAAAPATQPAPVAHQPLVMTTPGFGAAPTTQPAMLAAVTQTPMNPQGQTAKPASGLNAPAASAAPAAVSNQPLVDAKAKMDAKQLLEARRILNVALGGGTLPVQEQAAAKEMLNQINATVVFSGQRFNNDEYGGTYQVKPGDKLAKIAAQNDVTADLLLRLNGITDARKLKAGQNIKLIKGPFCAVVSKKDFTIELYQGDPGSKGSQYVTSFKVGLGKDDSTPTGSWMVDKKLKNPAYYSPRGEGVIDADDPKNPLGEYWIGLTGIEGAAANQKSYGIHGTIDPNSIGKMESMGCIRLKNEDVAQVYELLVEGKSTVVVKE